MRTEGIYTIMITLAIATATFYFAQQNYELFNGHSGLLPAFGRRSSGASTGATRARSTISASGLRPLAYLAVLYGARSTFGLTLQAIRDNPRRMRAVGYRRHGAQGLRLVPGRRHRRLAGVLLVWFNGRISPGTIDVGAAINVLIIAVIGGLRHPIGPFIGAIVVVLMQTFAIDIVGAERFNTLIGLVFLVIVFVSPDGLLGLVGQDQAPLAHRSRCVPARPQRRHGTMQKPKGGPKMNLQRRTLLALVLVDRPASRRRRWPRTRSRSACWRPSKARSPCWARTACAAR